jgi:DNA-binding NarL/FixJ family response regulator
MTLKILLVDDNLTFLAAVRKFIGLLPGTEIVAEAHDGQVALDLAAQLQPDLMLLDVVMPRMGGLDVAKALRTWVKAPRILFLSMHDNESYKSAAHELGALGFVGKADFVAELLPIIAKLVAEAVSNPANTQNQDGLL